MPVGIWTPSASSSFNHLSTLRKACSGKTTWATEVASRQSTSCQDLAPEGAISSATCLRAVTTQRRRWHGLQAL
jgi:hypothetical protein